MRRHDREVTDTQKIGEILARAKILHLGISGDKYPYVVPVHYGYEYENGSLTFYLHSATKGFKLDLIRKNPFVCAELETDVIPVSGGEIPCNYGTVYSSVIAYGKAEIVEDEREKIRGLEILMKQQTGKDFTITPHMAATVAVVKIRTEALTAKKRPAPTNA